MDDATNLNNLYKIITGREIGYILSAAPISSISQENRDAWQFVQDTIAADPDLSENFAFPFSPSVESEIEKYPRGKPGVDGLRDNAWIQRLGQYLVTSRHVLDAPIPDAAEVLSYAWTGIADAADRVLAARTLLPAARQAIEQLIASLSNFGHNGGPLIYDDEEGLEALRDLHRTLGEILAAINADGMTELPAGLVASSVDYAKRFASHVANDPMPVAVSTCIVAILTACGFPGAGAFLATVAMLPKKFET